VQKYNLIFEIPEIDLLIILKKGAQFKDDGRAQSCFEVLEVMALLKVSQIFKDEGESFV